MSERDTKRQAAESVLADPKRKLLPEELQVMSIEQLEFRLQLLEEKLPEITLAEGEELCGLYAFFRGRSGRTPVASPDKPPTARISREP